MPQLDISQQVERLRRLAGDFEALHSQVNGLAYRPGTDALYKISPLILKVQDLTAQAIRQLPALDVDDSRHTTSADSRSRLQTLASVVSSASLAGTDLANALYANPYQGTGFLGS
ncbi:MAG: hypothetical protein JO362_17610, partial [Streptomycetaceae bacterium]|nr:hypothetical protein [Streptomycetaceae bacterium]